MSTFASPRSLVGPKTAEIGRWTRPSNSTQARNFPGSPKSPMSFGSVYSTKVDEQIPSALQPQIKEAKERTVAESTLMDLIISDVWLSSHDRRSVRARLNSPTLPRISSPPVTTTEILLFDKNFAAASQRVPWLAAPSLRSLQASIRRRRLEVGKCGVANILFTAPRTIDIVHPRGNIVAAAYLGRLSRDFASLCGGSYITWANHEVARVRALDMPDRSNRDPCSLRDDELLASPWFVAMRTIREGMVSLWEPDGVMQSTIHIDLHGIPDPAESPVCADCVIGTGAMEKKLSKPRADELRSRIYQYLRPILTNMGMSIEADGKDEISQELGGGNIVQEQGKNTLTMQSVDWELFHHCGTVSFTHALTLALSKRLRRLLCENETARTKFIEALHFAVVGNLKNGVTASSIDATRHTSTAMRKTSTIIRAVNTFKKGARC